MVGDAEEKAKGEPPKGFYSHSTAIRIGKPNGETQSYLPVEFTCQGGSVVSKQFFKCLNTQFLEVLHLAGSNFMGRQKMRIKNQIKLAAWL